MGWLGESSHALRWFPGGQWLEKKEKQPDSGSAWAGCSPPLSWPGRVPGSQGAGRLFKDLGHRCSLLSAKIQRRTAARASGSCLPAFPNAWPHSFTHSSPLLLRTHLSRPRSGVAGTGDMEMNNTRKELALWEGRKPNASLEESNRAQRGSKERGK